MKTCNLDAGPHPRRFARCRSDRRAALVPTSMNATSCGWACGGICVSVRPAPFVDVVRSSGAKSLYLYM